MWPTPRLQDKTGTPRWSFPQPHASHTCAATPSPWSAAPSPAPPGPGAGASFPFLSPQGQSVRMDLTHPESLWGPQTPGAAGSPLWTRNERICFLASLVLRAHACHLPSPSTGAGGRDAQWTFTKGSSSPSSSLISRKRGGPAPGALCSSHDAWHQQARNKGMNLDDLLVN